MVELQILNKVLQSNSLTVIRQNNLNEDYFITYKKEFEYILSHYSKYGNVPDKETFLSKFEDFDLVEVTETDKYLVETIQEQYMYSKMVPFLNKVAEMVVKDAKEASRYVMSEAERISKLNIGLQTGYDIVKNSDDRKKEYKYRLEVEGLLGISSGLSEVDEITHGWLKEDLIIILGRTNEGKTWVLLFLLVMAWKLKSSVLLYSGEMSKTLIGFRFDTIYKNFSNEGLMAGNNELGKDLTSNEYYNYLDKLNEENCTPFNVVTPKDLGGERLTIPMLHQLIEMHKPDIVGIDQLSLMDDYRASRNDQQRMKYTHITEDLYLTSEKYGIPILTPSQANRDSADKSKKKDDDSAPEVHEISESDGIGQNATRVISIKQMGPTMKIAVKKNRYGKNNQEVLLLWDIDKGIVKPFLQVSTDKKGKTEEVKKLTEGEDLF